MVSGMKTTVEIDDALFRQAKVYAATHGHSLRSLLEEGLRARLSWPDHVDHRQVEREERARFNAIRRVVASAASDAVVDPRPAEEWLEWDADGLPR